MPYSRLFIWVEGVDDRRFFEKCIKPLLDDKYARVIVRQYQERPKAEIEKFVRPKNEWGLHLAFGDIDRQPCITAKKEQLIQKKFAHVKSEDLFVVVKEIENWYLAGLDTRSCEELGLPDHQDTDTVTKEEFDGFMSRTRFNSRVDFMQEILNLFSVDVAKAKNTSFRYFAIKHLLQATDSKSD